MFSSISSLDRRTIAIRGCQRQISPDRRGHGRTVTRFDRDSRDRDRQITRDIKRNVRPRVSAVCGDTAVSLIQIIGGAIIRDGERFRGHRDAALRSRFDRGVDHIGGGCITGVVNLNIRVWLIY